MGFGLIGFRDNSAAVEYAAKVFAPLAYPPNHDEFQRQIQNVQAARASTRGFNEDGLAGVVVKALELDEWKHFQARYIIYIGDSGLREPPRPSASPAAAQAVNSEARDKTTAIISLLLETHRAAPTTKWRSASFASSRPGSRASLSPSMPYRRATLPGSVRRSIR